MRDHTARETRELTLSELDLVAGGGKCEKGGSSVTYNQGNGNGNHDGNGFLNIASGDLDGNLNGNNVVIR